MHFFEILYKKQWLPYAIVLILTAAFVHSSTYYIQPDLDGGVVWSINEFFSFRQVAAFFYPHSNGPLYILKTPSEASYHIVASVLFNFFIRATLGFFLLRIANIETKNKWGATLVFLFFISFLNFDFILIASIIAASYYLIKSEALLEYIPTSLLIAMAIYIKGSVSFPSFFIFGSMLIFLLFQKKYKIVAQLAAIQCALFLILSTILYQNPLDGITWAMQSLLGSLSYGSDQAIYFNNFFPFLVPAFLFAIAGLLLIKNKDYRILYSITFLLVIIFWKYALGRQDFTHYRAWYFLCIMLIGFSLFLFQGQVRIRATVIYFMSFLFFMSNAKRADSPKPFTINTPNIASFATAILKPHQAKQLFANQSNHWNAKNILSDTLLQIIGNKTIDAYPWQTSILRKYALQYKPRPNFISTLLGPKADQSDSAHFASANSAEFILWHNSQPAAYQLNGHNKIYLANSNPKALISIQEHYTFQHYENGYALWKKRKEEKNKKTLLKENNTRNITMNKWFAAPAFDSLHVTYGKTNFALSFFDKLRSTIYKGRFFKIIYKLENQKEVLHFLSKESLQKHFILQPYFTNPRLDYKIIDSIKIQPMAPKFNGIPLQLSWSQKINLNNTQFE